MPHNVLNATCMSFIWFVVVNIVFLIIIILLLFMFILQLGLLQKQLPEDEYVISPLHREFRLWYPPPPPSLPAPLTLPTHNPSSCLDEMQIQFAKGIKCKYKYFLSRVLQKLHLPAVITTWSSQMWQLLREKIIIFKKDSKSVVFVSHLIG